MGPQFELFGCGKILTPQTSRIEPGADHDVAVYAYRTPRRFEEVKMNAVMLFPGGVTAKPFEVEETVLYLDPVSAL